MIKFTDLNEKQLIMDDKFLLFRLKFKLILNN